MPESRIAADAVERTLEDLLDDAELGDGVLSREAVDVLYLRRSIEPDQAAAIERQLRSRDIEVTVAQAEPAPPKKPPGPAGTAVDNLLWSTRGYPLLSADEEAACGEAMQRASAVCGRPAGERSSHELRLIQAGERARTKLILCNVRLVIKLALEPRHRNRLEVDDLIQMGLLGLMRAVEGFDPGMGTRFSTYAFWWIRQHMSRGIDDQAGTVRLPVYLQERVRRYRRASRRLGGRRGSTSVVADSLGWTESYAALVAGIAAMKMVPLDDEGRDDDGPPLGERLDSGIPSPEAVSQRDELLERVRALVRSLPTARLRDIVTKRFGLDGADRLTLQELGRKHGVSRERIRQLESKALRILEARAAREELFSVEPSS